MAKPRKTKKGIPKQQEPSCITIPQFSEIMHNLRCLVDSHCESPEASELACFIHNNGSDAEKAEALLAMLPIATRLMDRLDASKKVGAQ